MNDQDAFHANLIRVQQEQDWLTRHGAHWMDMRPKTINKAIRADWSDAIKENNKHIQPTAEDRVLLKASQLPADASADTLEMRQLRATAEMIREHRASPVYVD